LTEQAHDKDTEDMVSLYLEGCRGSESDQEFSLPPGGWRRLLSLAQMYGWQPRGTEAPDYPWLHEIKEEDFGIYWTGAQSDWDGRYFPGFMQKVTVEDARALGAALVRALPDLPDHEAFERVPEDPAAGDSSSKCLPCPKVDRRTTPFQLYSGKEKEVLRWLITHCLECNGGFWIWSYEDR